MSAVFLGARRLRLHDRDLLGEGGEGRVYRVGDRAVEVFLSASPAREAKLRAFPALLPPAVIAPLELCTDGGGAIVGYAMRAVEGAVDLQRFAQRSWRDGRVDAAAVLGLFRALAEAIARLHDRGVVVGDLNDGNVVATREAGRWTPWLIDADSMQFAGHRCVVAHERFLDPRLYGVDLRAREALSRESDWYALAALLFGALLYVHPFGGAHPKLPTLLRRAEARHSVLRADVKLPGAAVRPDVLSDDALGWFERVFERDAREPLPPAVLELRFARCSCGAEHARRACPRCAASVHVAPPIRARGSVRSARVFQTRGRIVAAAFQGGLRHAHEEDGALRREDGSIVARPDAAYFADPLRRVAIAGAATWIAAGGAMTRIEAGGEEVFPVDAVHGEAAADAGLAGLVHVAGDALVRAATATRIGLVLPGQTHVRVGDALGFAFYRAGGVTVAFVFDPRRGPLRQVEAFPRIEGKLRGWSATFSAAQADPADDTVLVTFAAEQGGRVVHATHLVDRRGAVLASGSDVLPPSLDGRAVVGRSVLAADDDGLLYQPACGAFAPVRAFADARDLVAADARLLAGPGGSLFVVTHDEVSRLMFY